MINDPEYDEYDYECDCSSCRPEDEDDDGDYPFDVVSMPTTPREWAGLKDIDLDAIGLKLDDSIRTDPEGRKYRVIYLTGDYALPPTPQRDPADFAGCPKLEPGTVIQAGNKPEDKAGVSWQDDFRKALMGSPGIGKSAYVGTEDSNDVFFLDEFDSPKVEDGQILDGQFRVQVAREVCCSELRVFERTLQGHMIDDPEGTLCDGEWSPALCLHFEEMKATTMAEAKRVMREWPRCWSTHELAVPEFSVQLVAFAPEGIRPSVTLHFRCPEHNGHSINEYKEV